MFEKEEMLSIYSGYTNEGLNKTELSVMWNVSQRTIGRVIDYVKSTIKDEKENTVLTNTSYNNEKYFIVGDSNLVGITRVILEGSSFAPESVIVYKNNKKYDQVMMLIESNDLKEAFEFANIKIQMEKLTEGAIVFDPTIPAMIYEHGGVEYQFGHDSMIKRMAEKLVAGEDVSGLMKFADRLAKNPRPEIVDELYQFLNAGDILIDHLGMVECYKRVRANFTDVHSGKFDNSIGNMVRMPRHKVDSNSAATCSNGLHVCSKAYLDHFGGEVVIKVLVDPADFVSIPMDYYSSDEDGQVKAKARVCEYYVIGLA
jgi:hypothetical protein